MYLERHGNGKKIYLGLHGWGADRKVFVPLIPLIPPTATFYSADLPGVLLSPEPSEWSVEAIVSEVLETVSAIGEPVVTIVGHCGGGVLGLLAAIENADLIERVVMIDPFAYLPGYFKVFLNRAIGKYAYQTTFANPVGRWVTNQALRNRRNAKADLTTTFRFADQQTAQNYLRIFAEAEKIEIPENLDVKIDLIHGAKTFGAVRKSVASLKKSLPQSRIWRLENAAHLPFIEATDELGKIIFEI